MPLSPNLQNILDSQENVNREGYHFILVEIHDERKRKKIVENAASSLRRTADNYKIRNLQFDPVDFEGIVIIKADREDYDLAIEQILEIKAKSEKSHKRKKDVGTDKEQVKKQKEESDGRDALLLLAKAGPKDRKAKEEYEGEEKAEDTVTTGAAATPAILQPQLMQRNLPAGYGSPEYQCWDLNERAYGIAWGPQSPSYNDWFNMGCRIPNSYVYRSPAIHPSMRYLVLVPAQPYAATPGYAANGFFGGAQQAAAQPTVQPSPVVSQPPQLVAPVAPQTLPSAAKNGK